MSFNYLEIEKATLEFLALKTLPVQIQKLGLVDWGALGRLGAGNLNEASLGFEFKDGSFLVFSFKQPWFGMFYGKSELFRFSKTNGASVFGPQFHQLMQKIEGKKLVSLKAVSGERIVWLEIEGGMRLQIDLIPSKPNWILTEEGEKNGIYYKQRLNEETVLPRPLASGLSFQVRDFSNWFSDSYHFYLRARVKTIVADILQKAVGKITARVVKYQKTKTEILKQEKESEKAASLKEHGELLKTVIYNYPKDFKVSNLEINEKVILLDSTKTLPENMELFFKRYKKLERMAEETRFRKSNVQDLLDKALFLKNQILQIQSELKSSGEEGFSFESFFSKLKPLFKQADLEDLLLEGSQESGSGKKNLSKKQKKWKESNLRHYKSKDGNDIWIGRNHRENEELVIRLARGGDIWMHIKGKPGAHGIIQLDRGKSASLETLLETAYLVAFYSGAKEGDKLEVDYTFRKNVKRVGGKGSDHFLVTYSQNKTLVIRFDKKKIAVREE